MTTLGEKATRQHTRDVNLRLVLRAIYELGAVSRADLARLTNLTRTTVSDVVAELMDRGLVVETGPATGGGVGRTPILLSVAEWSRPVAAISVNADAIEGALVSLRGAVGTPIRQPLAGRTGMDALAVLIEVLDSLTRAATQPLLGIGVTTPGLIDAGSGAVVRAVGLEWADLPLGQMLSERYALPVKVVNDSQCLALAEHLFGEWRGVQNVVVLKIGKGVGAGIVLNGQLYAGEGFGAGEIGHLAFTADGPLCKCGNRGCLETVLGADALLAQAQAAVIADPSSALAQHTADLSLTHIAAAATAGDPAAQRIVANAAAATGAAVATIISLLSVRHVLITGRIAAFGAAFIELVRREVAQRALPALVRDAEIRLAPVAATAPLIGAAAPVLTGELGLIRLHQREEPSDA
ncbi:ROK family transcriptional regulator [Chloroflexus sp.]|uniref:ROK family transcriptional regulator n=1 Tax=Chloroflexus sp. TaxID=1904827 RepID=UPI002ACD42DF|nr:ROK family transcriptional regulator [Chloroflexus sp.]